jgi:hypothetical protein
VQHLIQPFSAILQVVRSHPELQLTAPHFFMIIGKLIFIFELCVVVRMMIGLLFYLFASTDSTPRVGFAQTQLVDFVTIVFRGRFISTSTSSKPECLQQ